MKQKLLLSKQSLKQFKINYEVLHEYENGRVLVSVNTLPKVLPLDAILVGEGIASESQNDGVESLELESFGRNEEILAFIELIGPLAQEWLKTIEDEKIEILRYQPRNAYLCRAKAGVFGKVKKFSFVQNVRYLSVNYKPSIAASEGGLDSVWILYTGDISEKQTITDTLNNIQGVNIDEEHEIEQVDYYLRIKAKISNEGQKKLLLNHFVLAIENVIDAQPEGEVANLIIAGQYSDAGIPQGDYQKWLQDHDLDGRNVTVAVVDTGVDVSHEAFSGRIKDLAGGRKGWHGTFVASHIGGNYLEERDANGFIYGIGVAPQTNILSIDNSGVTQNPLLKAQESINNVAPNGQTAYIQNNSWGAGTSQPMNYGSLEAAYDRIVRNAAPNGKVPKPLVVCFSAGNSGSRGLTRPKAAKNVIVTGNSENYRPDIAQSFSDNIDDVYQDESWQPSSHGNCGDGRIRPDIVAPGEWTASINYNVSPHQAEYLSPKLVWGGGTSGASPKTAGACALLTQWWRQSRQGKNPSPAMLKALLVNGAKPMKSLISEPPIPSKVQGWGRLNLDTILSPNIKFEYLDQTKLLYGTGDKWETQLAIADINQPLKITLAWTDPPANINTGDSKSNSTIVNRLRLKLTTSDGRVFYGNNFANGWSIDGMPSLSTSYEDNLQNIFIQVNDLTDICTVEVEAIDITTNCFDFKYKNPQQDFALVIQNATIDDFNNVIDTVLIVDDGSDDIAGDQTDDIKDDSNWGEVNNNDNENSWWDDEPFEWFGEETLQSNESIHKPGISEKLETGISILESRPRSEKIDTNAKISIIEEGFGKTLYHLIEKWKETNLKEKNNVVFIVNKNTVLSKTIFHQIRQLSYLGELYFVSTDQNILCQIAQGTHRVQNVHFRFVTNPDKLSGHIRDTLIETSGAQGAKIIKGEIVEDIKTYTISLTVNDRRFALRINDVEEVPKHLKLKMPNGKTINLHSLSAKQKLWIDWKRVEQRLEINVNLINLSDKQIGGQWTLLTKSTIDVKGWVWGQPLFKHYFKLVDINKLLATVKNHHNSGINELSFLKRWICSENSKIGVHEESDQRVSPRKRTPYFEDQNEESSSRRNVPLLEDYISLEKNLEKIVLDLIIRVNGVDRLGNSYQRVIRTNYFNLTPLSESSKRILKERFVAAKTVRLYYKNGIVSGVRLLSKYGERDFLVTKPSHSKLFEQWKDSNHEIHFGLSGKYVKSLILFSRS